MKKQELKHPCESCREREATHQYICNTSEAMKKFASLPERVIEVCKICYDGLYDSETKTYNYALKEISQFIDVAVPVNKNIPPRRGEPMKIDPTKDIRIFRVERKNNFPPIEQNDDRICSLIGERYFKAIPEKAFGRNDIVVLHKQLMNAALTRDGISSGSIATQTRITKHDVRNYLDLIIRNPKTEPFPVFMKWIIEYGYTFNQIVKRKDANLLLTEQEEKVTHGVSDEEKEKQYQRYIVSDLLKLGWGRKAETVGLNMALLRRFEDRSQWKMISKETWKRIKRALDTYFGRNTTLLEIIKSNVTAPT